MIDYFSPSEDPAIPGPRAPSGQKNATAPPGVDTEKAAANATGGEEARDETALEALNANVKETDMKGGEDEDAEYDTLLLEDYRRSREEGTSAASVSQNHNASVESGATGGSGSAKAKKSKKKGEKEKEKGAHNERLLKKAADLQAQVNEVEAKLQKQKSAGAAGGALDTDQAPGLFGLGGGGSPHAAEGGGSSPPGSSGKEKETIKKSHTTAGGAPSSKVQLDPKLNASADPATFLGAIGGGPVAGEEEQPTSSGNDGGGAEGGGQPWSFLTSQ
uniref:Uncharacterized protein n=1 Tax=Chromera velia CCMP2878 TaxID=1169474 RepID=A0A0G4I665_9ALVE|eukprot:Cvel_11313.t1-p1 / transcript=Cvel_11313.t1 / gene=Cvel_11313 / organism=Chromera_velia_CCMP2878 / gene_product=hypothetical protein / transcript_product=hypothetical protein / location=Cvel_scaffold707:37171-43605(-) / protein_length=274 / sequence_SO=supercontig / SO=protein_coding / is_pseudo=false